MLRFHRPIVVVALLSAVYVGVAWYCLHFQISRILFPPTASISGTFAHSSFRVSSISGNELLVRRYGEMRAGCIVFFPGQHGGISSYEQTLFPRLIGTGVEVFSVSYPGQDGAVGRAQIGELQGLLRQAVAVVAQTCPMHKTVFVGRSLGSMLAAYTARDFGPVGLVLEGAAPSLSVAVITGLRQRWYLAPLSLLPISRLLRNDYSLSDALATIPQMPVIIFQGTADEIAPIESLRANGALPPSAELIAVEGGNHANTYRVAIEQYVGAPIRLLHQFAPPNPALNRTGRYAASCSRASARPAG